MHVAFFITFSLKKRMFMYRSCFELSL
jgi:hypothetical protein